MRNKNSYHRRRLQEQAIRDAAGLIADRYQGISCIEIRMTYYHRAPDPVLMERTLRFYPASHALFFMRCEHFGCADGGYDLAPVVDTLVRSGKASGKGTLFCHGSDSAISHGSIAYRVRITYAGGAAGRT